MAPLNIGAKAMYRRIGKRTLDIVVSVSVLLVLLPVILLVALLVRVYMGRGVLFCQERPGLDGKPFILMKFRTMSRAFASDGTPLPDSERLTAFGSFLRSTSLDELPSLINIIRGEMSLVGPRPLLMQYLELYTPEQMRRHEVLPGLTGWAQIHGRNAASWDERFTRDIWYVDNASLWVDLQILWYTVGKVLGREGVSQPGQATVEPFRGSPQAERQLNLDSGTAD
jgi:sugar transferase EpsL